jgi:hypothetical protein
MSVTVESAVSAVATASATPGEPAGTPAPGTVSAEALWRAVLCDREGNALSDVSTIAFDLSLNRGLNRPAAATMKLPSWHPYTCTLHSDGSPYCEVGVRSVKLYRRDNPGAGWQIVFNGILWHLEDEGDEDETWTQVTAYDPMVWWRYRPARGFDYSRKTKKLTYNGNFVSPKFAKPMGYISAGSVLKQMLDHSQSTAFGGLGGDNPLGEGELGISLSGGYVQESGANAIAIQPTDTPTTIAEMHKLLTDTVYLDVWIGPVDQVGNRTMGNLYAVTKAGTDKPWLHLQYGTGDYSVQQIRRERDMDQIANKIYYYLGPKQLDEERGWQGNVTKDGMPSGTRKDQGQPLPDNPPGFRGLVESRIDNSRAKYGVFMSISVYDSHQEYLDHDEWGGLWQMESYLRAEPRELLYVTPTRNGPYDLFDLELGDTIRVSAFDGIRRGFSQAVQRVVGYTIRVDEDMVEAIEELETSPNLV